MSKAKLKNLVESIDENILDLEGGKNFLNLNNTTKALTIKE